MKLINRTSYMDTLTSLIGVPDIKVITGIRRSGKSKLLEALRDYVEANLSNSNVIHINYNLDEFEGLLEYHALLAYVKATATASTRSPTLQSRATRGSTTSFTGTAAIISALALRHTPAWAASGSATRRIPPPFCRTPPHPSWTAAAVQRTT